MFSYEDGEIEADREDGERQTLEKERARERERERERTLALFEK